MNKIILQGIYTLIIFTCTLTSSILHATDQTVSGNLTVTGTTSINGSSIDLGTRADTSTLGLLVGYTDGTASSVEFDASRSANLWKWQQNGGTSLKVQMSLSDSNVLVLYDQSSTPVAKITLNPLGGSTFANSVTINGTDNQMANQTLTGSSSVLTEGLADGRYQLIGSSTVSLAGGTATGTSSIALGYGASASNDNGIAIGIFSAADGVDSMGFNNGQAEGDYSVALGASYAYGERSVSTQYGIANGAFSVAMSQATTNGDDSMAFGQGCETDNTFAIAMGYSSIASGPSSVALGQNISSTGSGSFAGGWYASATSDNAVALGCGTVASGYTSTALGYVTTSSGDASTTLGSNTTASGNASTALGTYTTASSYASVVMGQYNVGGFASQYGDISWDSSDPLLELGNGTDGSHLSDALIVYKNGDTTIQGSVNAASVSTSGNVTAPAFITTAPAGDIPMFTGS